MAPYTLEDQWQGLVRCVGSWEGNLSSYDPDGNLQRRQPSVLFLYVDSVDDRRRVENGEMPYTVKLRLRRCNDQSDTDGVNLQGTNFYQQGCVFDPEYGHLCSGKRFLELGSPSVFEKALNYKDSNGVIIARARMVTFFNAEHLTRFAVFRERSSGMSADLECPTVPESIANNNLVGTDAEVSVEALCGTWRATITSFHAYGNEGERTTKEHTFRKTIEGNELRTDGAASAVGIISDDRRSVMYDSGGVKRRLVFLGGALTSMNNVLVPKSGEDLIVEFGWLVKKDFRIRGWRRYTGDTWVESCFSHEVRESD